MSGRRVTTYSHRRSRARGSEASPAGLSSAQQHDARDAGASLNGRSGAGKRARQSALSRTNSTDPNRSIKRPRKIDSEANAMSLDTPFGMTSATYDYETPANAMDSSITMTSGGGPKVLPPRTDRMSPVRAPSGSRTASRGLKENTGTSRSASRSGKATAPGQTRVKLGLASPFHSQPGSAPESPKKTTQMSAKKARTLSNASEDLEVASVHVSHRRRLSGPSTSLFVNVPDEHWLRPARVLGSSPFTVDYVPSETPVPFDLPDWSIDSATFAEPGPLRMSTPPLRRRVPQEGALSAPNSPSDEEDADMSDDNAKTPGTSLRRSRTKSYSADSILDYDSIMDSTLEVTAAKSASRRSVVRRGDGRSSLEISAPREIDTDVNRPTTAPSSPDNSRILPDELTSMFNDLGIAALAYTLP
ncbi:hypothetical protein PENSPDRAFT_753460 [Peniophora sp. CONT]|nr:hypothetical protein PENSPDRAFT_753460 [Peniophora sp. CONT]